MRKTLIFIVRCIFGTFLLIFLLLLPHKCTDSKHVFGRWMASPGRPFPCQEHHCVWCGYVEFQFQGVYKEQVETKHETSIVKSIPAIRRLTIYIDNLGNKHEVADGDFDEFKAVMDNRKLSFEPAIIVRSKGGTNQIIKLSLLWDFDTRMSSKGQSWKIIEQTVDSDDNIHDRICD